MAEHPSNDCIYVLYAKQRQPVFVLSEKQRGPITSEKMECDFAEPIELALVDQFGTLW